MGLYDNSDYNSQGSDPYRNLLYSQQETPSMINPTYDGGAYLMDAAMRGQQQQRMPYPHNPVYSAPRNSAPWQQQGQMGGQRQSRGAMPGYGNNFPQINPDAANQMLGQYGLSLPTPEQINPYVNFPNAGFMQRHQRIGGALDMIMSTLGNMTTGPTIGDNISGVARGLMGAMQAKKQNVANQMEAPFAVAQQMQSLQAGQDAHILSGAHAGFYNAQTANKENSLDLRERALELKQLQIDGAIHTDPYTGNVIARNPKTGDWEPRPDLNMGTKDPATEIYIQRKKDAENQLGRPLSGDEQWKLYNGMQQNIQSNKKLGKYPPGSGKGGASTKIEPIDTLNYNNSKSIVDQAQKEYDKFNAMKPGAQAKVASQNGIDDPDEYGKRLFQSAQEAKQHHQQLIDTYNKKYQRDASPIAPPGGGSQYSPNNPFAK